jgi:chromosome segregation ATPase
VRFFKKQRTNELLRLSRFHQSIKKTPKRPYINNDYHISSQELGALQYLQSENARLSAELAAAKEQGEQLEAARQQADAARLQNEAELKKALQEKAALERQVARLLPLASKASAIRRKNRKSMREREEQINGAYVRSVCLCGVCLCVVCVLFYYFCFWLFSCFNQAQQLHF